MKGEGKWINVIGAIQRVQDGSKIVSNESSPREYRYEEGIGQCSRVHSNLIKQVITLAIGIFPNTMQTKRTWISSLKSPHPPILEKEGTSQVATTRRYNKKQYRVIQSRSDDSSNNNRKSSHHNGQASLNIRRRAWERRNRARARRRDRCASSACHPTARHRCDIHPSDGIWDSGADCASCWGAVAGH